MLELVIPSFEYKEAFSKMLRDYDNNNESFIGDNKFDVEKYIELKLDESKGINLRPDRGRQTEYWLVDKEKNIIGTTRLRYEVNNNLNLNRGNIGYDISPSYRKKGCGNLILKLILDKAKLANLKRVLLTVDEDNIASEKIIIANGGVYEGSIYVDEVKKVVKRYWINVI